MLDVYCVPLYLGTIAAITEPIEFNIGYELWGFAPVECEGAPEQTGTFSTNQCIDLSAYDGKFTLEISSTFLFVSLHTAVEVTDNGHR